VIFGVNLSTFKKGWLSIPRETEVADAPLVGHSLRSIWPRRIAAISMVGLIAALCLIFQGARAVAAAETDRRPKLAHSILLYLRKA
jgi:hypothetical protein